MSEKRYTDCGDPQGLLDMLREHLHRKVIITVDIAPGLQSVTGEILGIDDLTLYINAFDVKKGNNEIARRSIIGIRVKSNLYEPRHPQEVTA